MKKLALALALVPGVVFAQIQSGPAMRKAGNHTFTFTGAPTVVSLSTTNFGTGTSLPGGWSGSGGWSVSTSNASSGFGGASGGSNAAGSNSGTAISQLTVSNINTVGYESITVIWGARRSASFTNAVTLQWSTNGSTWSDVSYTQVNNDTTWALVNGGTPIALPVGAAGASNLRLRLRYTQENNSGVYRIDDFIVRGTAVVSWTVDRHTRAELTTGSFSTSSGVMTATGISAQFDLSYVSGKETKYTIRAQMTGDSPYSQAVQVFPADVRASFMFTSTGNPTVPVYLIVPDSLDPATTKAISIHHGVGRNGDEYCDYWHAWATVNDTIAFAPTFTEADWPGESSYHQGNIILSSSSLKPTSQWSFTVAREIMEKILADFGLATTQVDAWGHSAGAQFVHRMALFQAGAPVRFWMVNNPGYWTLADLNVAWPHGFSHGALSHLTGTDITNWTNQRMVVFRGASDIHRDSSLNTGALSDFQGGYRYSRADTAFSRVAMHNASHHWSLHDVPFVGHSGDLMAAHGGAFLDANPWGTSAHTLSVSHAGTGNGIVHYPSDQLFGDQAVVTLYAVPEEGSAFVGWSGALSGSDNPAIIAMNADKAVSATFDATTRRVLYWTGFDQSANFPSNWSAGSGWTLSTSNQAGGYGGSSHRTGASAYRNAVIQRGGGGTHNLVLANLNTTGYSNIRVSWGARRSNSFTGQVTFQWSSDGSNWNSVSWTDVPNTSEWGRIDEIELPSGAAGLTNLRLRWRWNQSGSSAATYRMDDVVVTGVNSTTRTTVLTQTFGSGSSLPSQWTSSGTGWAVESSSSSAGYSGASGGSNLRASNSGGSGLASVTSAPIDTTGYRHLSVSWGARRSNSFFNPVRLQWSVNGTDWFDLPYREVPNDTVWRRINDSVEVELPVAAWNVSALLLRWSFERANNGGIYRLDDVRITGVAAAGSMGE